MISDVKASLNLDVENHQWLCEIWSRLARHYRHVTSLEVTPQWKIDTSWSVIVNFSTEDASYTVDNDSSIHSQEFSLLMVKVCFLMNGKLISEHFLRWFVSPHADASLNINFVKDDGIWSITLSSVHNATLQIRWPLTNTHRMMLTVALA